MKKTKNKKNNTQTNTEFGYNMFKPLMTCMYCSCTCDHISSGTGVKSYKKNKQKTLNKN